MQIQTKRAHRLSRWACTLPSGQEAPSLSGIRVLLVDDDPANREVMGELLRYYGAQTDLCADGAQALSTLSASPPDVVLSDICMPTMDGFELIEHIRCLPIEAGGTTPALAISAMGAENRERALACGFDDLLPKPVDYQRLVQAIHDLACKR